METTEKIGEAYVRYIKRWATIPNIKCKGQREIDLLAVDPKDESRYHIEVGVSISGGFSELTNKPYDPEKLKIRGQTPSQRRTFGFFKDKKFASPEVVEKLSEYGFHDGNYRKIIVTWGWQNGVREKADTEGIELWDFRNLVKEIIEDLRGRRTYFTDDTMRTLHLYARAAKL